MSVSNFNSIVSAKEAENLKEMIFNRARERAKALADEVQSSYTDSVQADIMDLARNSFVLNKNPFVEAAKPTVSDEKPKKEEEIGFSQRKLNNIKLQIADSNKSVSADIANKEIEWTMNGARNEFVNKSTFTGALEFLNSQATIALVNKCHGKTFNAIA